MQELIYNEDNVKDNELDKIVTRVKLLKMNTKNQILISNCDGIYQFPGGHIRENEDYFTGLKREVQEETGIEINVQGLQPFFLIKHYKRNFEDMGINKLSQIYYYFIQSDDEVRYDNTNFDEYEKLGNYKAKHVDIKDVEKILRDNVINNKKNETIVNEMVIVLKHKLGHLM